MNEKRTINGDFGFFEAREFRLAAKFWISTKIKNCNSNFCAKTNLIITRSKKNNRYLNFVNIGFSLLISNLVYRCHRKQRDT